MKKPCVKCSGTGAITEVHRQRWGSSKNWCYTGHTIPINYTCKYCRGTGKVDHKPARAA